MTAWNWALLGLFVWVTLIPMVAVWVSRVLHRRAQELPDYCRCGHLAEVHDHYRAGHECAICDCTKFCHGG